MGNLPAGPLVQGYNGVTFPTETETLEITSRPIPDPAGRAVSHILYSITLRFIVAVANQALSQTTDATLQSLRVLLQQYGGALSYANVGYGNLVINTGDRVKDISWGPKPTEMRWKPMGQEAAEVTWRVEVRIPECPDVANYQFALMEFNYRLTFDVDRSGYTTRTYSGHLKIPQTRQGANVRLLSDNADLYREQIVPALLDGYRRIPGPFDVSADKCRLDWSIKDEQIGPNFPPPGIVEVSMSHTVRTAETVGYEYVGRITATYEVATDTARAVAMGYFLKYVGTKLGIASGTPYETKAGPLKNNVLGRTFEASEPEIYGKKGASFAFTYTFLASINTLMKSSGLWIPVPDNDPVSWRQSLANTAFNPRGISGLGSFPNEEIIVDLCLQAPPVQRDLKTAAPPRVLSTIPGTKYVISTVTPETSWMDYKNTIYIVPEDQTAELQVLPTQPVPFPSNGYTPNGAFGQAATQTNPPSPPADGGSIPVTADPTLSGYPIQCPPGPSIGSPVVNPGDPTSQQQASVIFQNRAPARFHVELTGYAIRAGYPIPSPALLSVGNQKAVPVNVPGCGVRQALVDNWMGVPIYAARWRWRYALPSPPTGTISLPPVPYNPPPDYKTA